MPQDLAHSPLGPAPASGLSHMLPRPLQPGACLRTWPTVPWARRLPPDVAKVAPQPLQPGACLRTWPNCHHSLCSPEPASGFAPDFRGSNPEPKMKLACTDPADPPEAQQLSCSPPAHGFGAYEARWLYKGTGQYKAVHMRAVPSCLMSHQWHGGRSKNRSSDVPHGMPRPNSLHRLP
jgi:hypothetical protein